MNKIYSFVIMIFLTGVVVRPAVAQSEEDIAQFLEAGGSDASKLIEAYVGPAIKSISYGMTGGWYTTAKTHKTLGFDFGVSMNLAFIPTSENFFDPNALGLSGAITYEGNKGTSASGTLDPNRKAPTLFGPGERTEYSATYDPDGNGTQTFSFDGPQGLDMKNKIGFAAVPIPMAQLGIGVIKNTDLKFRFVPRINFGESHFQMFGVGVMHDVKQHIKGIKLLPFDLSALVAFNSVSGSTDLSSSSSPASTNGKLDYKFNSWVLQALISKKIAVLTGYAGVGYSIVKTNFDVTGDYTIEAASTDTFVISDPVGIDFKNNSMRLTAGMRINLGPIYFSGDYTLQKYNTLTVGFGCTVR